MKLPTRYNRRIKPGHDHDIRTVIEENISFHVCDCGHKQAFDMPDPRKGEVGR